MSFSISVQDLGSQDFYRKSSREIRQEERSNLYLAPIVKKDVDEERDDLTYRVDTQGDIFAAGT